ncbi:hypothetical protein Cgig2_007136 [Carnegiea gigantea]|uniref:Uncharacterized protein n=1 Tax=Carnegiea gigantea TaxID=171969 RepID=A0A9Q1KMH0_9CARY|nr:hypothetical protein Cgig2_007136 [Carnegiea gigantea]
MTSNYDDLVPIDVDSNGEEIAEVDSRQARRPTTAQTNCYTYFGSSYLVVNPMGRWWKSHKMELRKIAILQFLLPHSAQRFKIPASADVWQISGSQSGSGRCLVLFFFLIDQDAVQLKAFSIALMASFILISATKLPPSFSSSSAVLRNMIGGRQLPLWMLKSNAADQANSSEIKEINKDVDTEAVDNKACKSQRKIQQKEPDTRVTLLKKKGHLLKRCEATRNRRLIKQDEDQVVHIDDIGQEKKVNIKAGKSSQQRDGEHLLDKCEKSRWKRMSNKGPHDQSDDFCDGESEDKVDIAARKGRQSNASRRKKRKKKDFMEGSHDEIIDSIASDDEVTVEDLISIAEEVHYFVEYINAEKERELQKLQNVTFESNVKPLPAATSKIWSEKDLTTNVENTPSFTDKLLSADSSVMKPSLGGGSIANPVSTGDPARDMLDLFLGPLLKTSGEVEREANTMTEKLRLDHELTRRSRNDTVVDAAPVTKKKSSLRDKVSALAFMMLPRQEDLLDDLLTMEIKLMQTKIEAEIEQSQAPEGQSQSPPFGRFTAALPFPSPSPSMAPQRRVTVSGSRGHGRKASGSGTSAFPSPSLLGRNSKAPAPTHPSGSFTPCTPLTVVLDGDYPPTKKTRGTSSV